VVSGETRIRWIVKRLAQVSLGIGVWLGVVAGRGARFSAGFEPVRVVWRPVGPCCVGVGADSITAVRSSSQPATAATAWAFSPPNG